MSRWVRFAVALSPCVFVLLLCNKRRKGKAERGEMSDLLSGRIIAGVLQISTVLIFQTCKSIYQPVLL